jgi:hypothetical protein
LGGADFVTSVSSWFAQPHNTISKKAASRLKGFTQVSCSYNSNGGGGIDSNPKKKIVSGLGLPQER